MLTLTSTNIEELLTYVKGEKPTLTMYSTVKYQHPKKTNGKPILTTYGRVLFNALLPEDYPFINEPINRGKLKKILNDIAEKYPADVYKKVVYDIQRYSMLISTIVPATIEISKLQLPEELQKIKDELTNNAKNMDPVEFDRKVDELYEQLKEYLKKEGVTFFDMVESGTKGKKTDLQQLFLAWGPAYQPLSDDMPIISHSLLEGMTPEELYYGANKARYAAFLKSINVAPIGYLARKMRWALSDVEISKTTEDCKTKKYFEITVTEDIAKLILGRYYFDEKDKQLKLIDETNIKDLVGKQIKLRSPLYCKAKDGICKTCYGNLYEQHKSGNIGINAALSMHVITLNMFMKLSKTKLTARDETNFIKEIQKWYS